MSRLQAFSHRNIFEPAYCFISGNPKLRYWRALEQTQYLPEPKLREIQWRRLQEMLRFVHENNGFYRRRFHEAGVSPKDIQSPEDLRRLPLLSKSDIRGNTLAMISRPFDIQKLQAAKTGGSTGKPLTVFFTEECGWLRNACALRHDLWSGWRRGEPIAAVWGNPVFTASLKEKVRQFLALPKMIFLDTMALSLESVTRFARQCRQVKPTLLFGHAHSVFAVAKLLQEMGIDCLRPKGIISTSMMLIPPERRAIEEVFGVKVTDRYGCEEVGLIASECERHEGMHVNIEHLFIEFVKEDGTAAVHGEEGRLVVTDLLNYAMPMIRYQVEDLGVPTQRKCSCGRGLPMMERVSGRLSDFLIKEDGTRIAGISLIENTLTKIPAIKQMQIVQESIELILLNIVAGEGFGASEEEELTGYFSRLFDCKAEVKIHYMDEIPREPSGKYMFSKCKIKMQRAI